MVEIKIPNDQLFLLWIGQFFFTFFYLITFQDLKKLNSDWFWSKKTHFLLNNLKNLILRQKKWIPTNFDLKNPIFLPKKGLSEKMGFFRSKLVGIHFFLEKTKKISKKIALVMN